MGAKVLEPAPLALWAVEGNRAPHAQLWLDLLTDIQNYVLASSDRRATDNFRAAAFPKRRRPRTQPRPPCPDPLSSSGGAVNKREDPTNSGDTSRRGIRANSTTARVRAGAKAEPLGWIPATRARAPRKRGYTHGHAGQAEPETRHKPG